MSDPTCIGNQLVLVMVFMMEVRGMGNTGASRDYHSLFLITRESRCVIFIFLVSYCFTTLVYVCNLDSIYDDRMAIIAIQRF